MRQKFLFTDNKHRKLFVIKQSKGCKFTPKMHQNTFGGGEALMCSLAAMGAYFQGEWVKGRKVQGPTYYYYYYYYLLRH